MQHWVLFVLAGLLLSTQAKTSENDSPAHDGFDPDFTANEATLTENNPVDQSAPTGASPGGFDYSKFVPGGSAAGSGSGSSSAGGFDYSQFMPGAKKPKSQAVSTAASPAGGFDYSKFMSGGAGSGSASSAGGFDYSKFMSGGAGSGSASPAGGFDYSKFMGGSTPQKASPRDFAAWKSWMRKQTRKSWRAWCSYMCRQNKKQGLASTRSYHTYMTAHNVTNWKSFAKLLASKNITSFNQYNKWTSQHAVLATSYDWEAYAKKLVKNMPKKKSLQCTFMKCPADRPICEMGMCKPKGSAPGFAFQPAPATTIKPAAAVL